jgi:DHA3 family tetracycline resistance protein-like MFS transporter
VVADIRRHFSAMRHQVASGSRIIRRSPLLLGLVGAAFFEGMSSEGFDRLGQAQLLDVGGIPAPTAIWLAGLSIVAMLMSVVLTEGIRRRLDAMSGPGMVLLTAVLYGAAVFGLLAFAVGGSFAPLAAAYVVVSACRSSCRPVVNAALVAATAPATRATVFSYQSQAGALGQVAGGPPVGAIAQGYGLSAGLTCAACFLAPAVGCLVGAARKVHRDLRVRPATSSGRPYPGRGRPPA